MLKLMEKKFNQSEYNYQWQKDNMKFISVRYNSAFVDEFKNVCKSLGLVQSDVFRKVMQEVIDQAQRNTQGTMIFN